MTWRLRFTTALGKTKWLSTKVQTLEQANLQGKLYAQKAYRYGLVFEGAINNGESYGISSVL